MSSQTNQTIEMDVLGGPPGCGKSTLIRKEAVEAPDRYLIVAPITELIDEYAAALAQEAPRLDITVAHHLAPGRGGVQQRLDDAVDRIESGAIRHAVVLASHETLMGKDISRFANFHLRIDEAPNAVQSGLIRAPSFPAFLETVFGLEEVGTTGWAELTLLTDPPRWQDLARDDLFAPLAELVKQVQRGQGVFVDRTKWGKAFGWCSVWLPTDLGHFASIKVAAASYPTSLGAVIAKRTLGDTLRFNEVAIPMNRTGHPKVRLHYFTRAHEGTTTYWQKPNGILCLHRVSDFLSRLSSPIAFWGANEVVEPHLIHRLSGDRLKPKAAGLNKCRDETSCAMIFSSKATPSDKVLKSIFGLTNEDFLAGREDEDIFQFATRGIIRNPAYDGDYDVYVYSLRQAERLRERLLRSGLLNVCLVAEFGPGIMDFDGATQSRISSALAELKAADRRGKKAGYERERRARQAEAAGRIPRKPGRPPRAIGPPPDP